MEIVKNRNRNAYTFANINLLGHCNANCYFCLGKDIAEIKRDTTKKQIKSYVIRQFEEQWQEYEADLKADGVEVRRNRPLLKKHVSWVFRRVCLKESYQNQ